MQTNKTLRRLLLFSFSILLCSLCYAQSTTDAGNDSTGLHAYAISRGNMLTINYDTAYILNGMTFKLLQGTYKKVQSGNPELKSLLDTYDVIYKTQDSLIRSKEFYYQQLKGSFDSLVDNTTSFVKRTDTNITAINVSLSTATNELNNVKSLLDDSLQRLKQENRQKFKIAIGAFTVGLGAAAVVFLVTK